MPTKDNLELYEEREREILEELGRREMTDTSRERLVKELDTIAKIKSTYEQNDQNRLNNYAKNEIEETRMEIEKAKVEVDKGKVVAGIITGLTSFFGGCGMFWLSYHMDETQWAFKDMKNFGMKCVDGVKNLFKGR